MAVMKGEGFVNFMMMMVCAPVVMAWVALAGILIVQAFSDEAIVTDIEAYKSVLLIVGSPALVIIYKTLELWTAQQNSHIEQVRKGTFSDDEHIHIEKPKSKKKLEMTAKDAGLAFIIGIVLIIQARYVF